MRSNYQQCQHLTRPAQVFVILDTHIYNRSSDVDSSTCRFVVVVSSLVWSGLVWLGCVGHRRHIYQTAQTTTKTVKPNTAFARRTRLLASAD